MKKVIAVLCVLVVAAAVALGITISNKNDLQAKLDAANTTASDQVTKLQADAATAADDAAKALEDAKASAAAELENVKAEAAAAAETAAKELEDVKAAAAAELETVKADAAAKLEAVSTELETLKADAASAAEAAAKELEEVKAQAAKELEAVKADDAVAALTAELENVKADAAAKLEEAKTAAAAELENVKAEAAAAAETAAKALEDAKAEAAAQVEALTKELEEAKNNAAQAVTEVVENTTKAVTETVENTTEAVTETVENTTEAVENVTEAAGPAAPAVMSHADYIAAELQTEVTVETYVQDKQSWYNDKATIYCQSEDGAYFIFEMPISQEEYEKLVPGTKIRVTGYKSEWAEEVEITEAKYEILEGEAFIPTAVDVTALLGTDELINHQNELVVFKGMTVEAYDESNAAFAYKDPVGKTDDLYFKVSKDGATYEFCVEFYLRGQDTDVYKAVEGLKVGDVIDLEGYLYWYKGVNPHIISVKAAE